MCFLWVLCVTYIGERPGICCCFYGTTHTNTHTHGICLVGCVHYEVGFGWWLFPFAPPTWLCFAILSLRGVVSEKTDLKFKPI